MCVKLLLSICLIKVLWFYEFLINFLASKELKEENSCLQTWIRQKCLKRLLEEYTGETIGYISYAIKKVRNSQLLIFEKNGPVWPADIWPAHFFQILKVRKI